MRPLPTISAVKNLVETRFFRVDEETLDQGYPYYSVTSKFDAVIVIPVLPDGRLVVERIYRHPYRRFVLEFPAGGIEPGEDILHAAGRELAEETGYSAKNLTLLGSKLVMPGLMVMRSHFVLATGLVKDHDLAHEVMELIEPVILSSEEAWKHAKNDQNGEAASSFLVDGLLYLEHYLNRNPDNGA